MYLIGIDETARCPALGPLYCLGIACDSRTVDALAKKLVLKDSKLTTPAQRKAVFDYVMKHHKSFKWELVKLEPFLIDLALSKRIRFGDYKLNLNDLEAIAFADIIVKLRKRIGKAEIAVYINNFEKTPEQLINRWKRLEQYDKIKGIEIHLTHSYNNIISLASMFCKHIEDMETQMWKFVTGFDFGSKNPNDKRVWEFVKRFPNSQLIRRNWGKNVPRILKQVKDRGGGRNEDY